MRVALEAGKLSIDGAPALLQAGALHYFRLPHADLWQSALLHWRMAGLNAALVPLPWAYHSPAPGLYDFTGPRDLRRLFDAVAAAGLWLLADIGPWITAGLDAGGVPPWLGRLPDALPLEVPAPFLRHTREWWERLCPYFAAAPNLLLTILHPGVDAEGALLHQLVPALAALAREVGLSAPCVVAQPGGGWLAAAEPAVEIGPGVLNLAAAEPLPETHPRPLLCARLAAGPSAGYALTPGHASAAWGYWGASSDSPAAPFAAGPGLNAAYFHTRRLAYALETLGRAAVAGTPDARVYASAEGALLAARGTAEGAVAFLAPSAKGVVRLSLAGSDEMLTSAPLAGAAHTLLPVDWALAGGRLLFTTLEPVLTITVAGRHLLVVANESGGDLLLSGDFRPRHARGPVRTQRAGGRLAIRCEAGKLVSLLLDGPEKPLQILALSPEFAARVWPLDDTWRNTPTFPAHWQPQPEDPARGLVIGPDFVLPRADGSYEYLVGAKGYGYRWGPWRGSDPHTWLAPLTWRAPVPLPLPRLTWASQPGAAEALPDYEDAAWTQVAHSAPLSLEAQGIQRGFAWYRGRFAGAAAEVTLRCDDTGDLFFNGELIATLHAPRDEHDGAPKTLPLPARLLREENVLALLVERRGDGETWDAVARPTGLGSATLDSGARIRWRVRAGLGAERTWQGFAGYAEWPLIPGGGAADVTWHRAQFVLDWPEAVEAALYLTLEHSPGRAYVFLNGMLIGRSRGAGQSAGQLTRRIWLPAGVLQRRGHNELLIAQWLRGAQPGLGIARLELGPVFHRLTAP